MDRGSARPPAAQAAAADEELTIMAAAARLGINRTTLAGAIEDERLPARKAAGRWLVRAGDVAEWRAFANHVGGQTRKPPAGPPPKRWPTRRRTSAADRATVCDRAPVAPGRLGPDGGAASARDPVAR